MLIRRTHRLSIIGFIIAAIVFYAAGGIFLHRDMQFKKFGVPATAVITEIETDHGFSAADTEYKVYVVFTTEEGETIHALLDTYNMGMYEGKEIPVLYMPDNPSDVTYAEFSEVVVVLCFIAGSILAAVSVTTSIFVIKKKRLAELKRNGTLVSATVSDFCVLKQVKFTRKYFAKLTCYDNSGNQYTARFLARSDADYTLGNRIDVYVSAKNPHRYAIDTEKSDT